MSMDEFIEILVIFFIAWAIFSVIAIFIIEKKYDYKPKKKRKK